MCLLFRNASGQVVVLRFTKKSYRRTPILEPQLLNSVFLRASSVVLHVTKISKRRSSNPKLPTSILKLRVTPWLLWVTLGKKKLGHISNFATLLAQVLKVAIGNNETVSVLFPLYYVLPIYISLHNLPHQPICSILFFNIS